MTPAKWLSGPTPRPRLGKEYFSFPPGKSLGRSGVEIPFHREVFLGR